MARLLEGLEVLDLSRIHADPWSTQILSDLGVEVWKIKRPGSGDDKRHWDPPYLKDVDGNDTEDSAISKRLIAENARSASTSNRQRGKILYACSPKRRATSLRVTSLMIWTSAVLDNRTSRQSGQASFIARLPGTATPSVTKSGPIMTWLFRRSTT